MSEETFESGSPETGDKPIPIRPVAAEALDGLVAELPGAQAAWVRANGFNARLGTALALPGADGSVERVLVGWGTGAERRRERLHLGSFARAAPAGSYRLEGDLSGPEAEQAALGWMLGRYRFDRYKSDSAPKEGDSEADLETPEGVDDARLGRIAEGVFITRDLINTPANEMGPEALERAVRRIAERHGAQVEVTTGEALLKANLPLIHAVGRAGPEAPRLIDLHWGNADDPAVTLVGKGVCFDTGGLNLKPSGSMALMKKDMCGAATVLGLAHMIMGLGLGLRLRVLIPAVENSVASVAMRPGDVLTSRKGLTVEINNTDAEGQAGAGRRAGAGERGRPRPDRRHGDPDRFRKGGRWGPTWPPFSPMTRPWRRSSRRPPSKRPTRSGGCRCGRLTRATSSPASPIWTTHRRGDLPARSRRRCS